MIKFVLYLHHSRLKAYGFAGLCFAVVLALRFVLYVFDQHPFPTLTAFLPAIAVASICAGLVPGLAVVWLSLLAAWRWFVPPGADHAVQVELTTFGLIATSVSIAGDWMRGLLIENYDVQQRQIRANQLLLDGVADFALILLDKDAQISAWNAGAERIFGHTAEQILGQPYRVLFPVDAPPDVTKAALAAALRDGVHHETAYRRRADSTAFLAEISFAALRNDNGSLVGFAKVIRDITEAERQRVANEELTKQLQQHERSAALGRLAGGVAHDFNNVLQTLRHNVERIHSRTEHLPEITRTVDKMVGAIVRGGAITQRLLTFARVEKMQPGPVPTGKFLADMSELLRHTVTSNITIQIEALLSLPPMLVDRQQMETVLVNLVVNARDAMPDGGRLTLAAQASQDAPGLPSGLYVRLAVSDTGTGMDAQTLSHAAEPFYTTKPRGQGTGLGLALAQNFANESGGAMQVHSEPGAGTTVLLWLPALAVAAEPEGVAPCQPVPSPGRSPVVLVVDDNEPVLETLVESLDDEGFTTLAAADGNEAIAKLEEAPVVDVLVTDLSMPGMNGLALIREAQSRRPGLPAVLITGNVGDVEGKAPPSDRYVMLRKPFAPRALCDQVLALSG